MEIGVKETNDVTFTPEIGKEDPETLGAMSMAVVKINDYYSTLFRELHQPEAPQPILESVLAFASSKNGVDFERSGVVALRPTKKPESFDRLAVEDPTIVKMDGIYYVFHTAVRPASGRGVETAIQLASGKSLENIGNKRIILTPQDVKVDLGSVNMVKEPEFFQLPDGSWTMIYEFADFEKSRIAIATSKNLTGPYSGHRILLDTRSDFWDSQHTSPGPLFSTSRRDICMFYNGRGARNELDQTPTWAIGYVIIDTKTGAISNRSETPIIRPPNEIGPDNQLIAFANSLVQEGDRRIQTLYYTIADKRSACARIAADL